MKTFLEVEEIRRSAVFVVEVGATVAANRTLRVLFRPQPATETTAAVPAREENFDHLQDLRSKVRACDSIVIVMQS